EIAFVAQFGALDFGCVNHPGENDPRSALHVVVVDTVFVPITLQEVYSNDTGPILEMDAALWEHLLDRLYELVDEGIELFSGWPSFAHTQIQRIVQVLLIIRPCIEIHRQ